MDTAPQPTEEINPADALLEQARVFILDLIVYIESIFERLGTAPLSNRLAARLMPYALIPAETALRRAILIFSAGISVPAMKFSPRPKDQSVPKTAPAEPMQPGTPRPPRFNMYEPQPPADLPPLADGLPADHTPRIRLLTDDLLMAPAEPLAPLAPLRPPRNTAEIFRYRFAALCAAFNDAPGEAARWARRRARAEARAKAAGAAAPPKIRPPLSSLTLRRLRKSLDAAGRTLLRDLTDLAARCLQPNTS